VAEEDKGKRRPRGRIHLDVDVDVDVVSPLVDRRRSNDGPAEVLLWKQRLGRDE